MSGSRLTIHLSSQKKKSPLRYGALRRLASTPALSLKTWRRRSISLSFTSASFILQFSLFIFRFDALSGKSFL